MLFNKTDNVRPTTYKVFYHVIEYLQEYLSTVYGYKTEYFCCQRMFFNTKNLYPAYIGIEIYMFLYVMLALFHQIITSFSSVPSFFRFLYARK